jgi:predicted SAM-dependent methyltransferase
VTSATSSPKRVHMARWLQGEGIELGALHKPLPVPATARVSYVDRLSVDDLREHYPELADLDLVPVSHIGSAEDLSAFPDCSLDFVIACHVLEHLEDPTNGLREIHRVLREGGIFYCALPEARVTFDRQRALTTVDHLLVDHPAGRTTRREHFVDWVVNVEQHQPWWQDEKPELEARVERLMRMDYSIHYHVWQPTTFLEYLAAVRRQLGIVFEVLDFAGCEPDADDEFVLILRRGIAPTPATPPQQPQQQAAPPARRPLWRRVLGRARRMLRSRR